MVIQSTTRASYEEGIYLAIALRNVGNGLAVLDRWAFYGHREMGNFSRHELERFR
jgi:hypothetical protein